MKKTCKTFGVSKSLLEFNKHPQMRDGHLRVCKACQKEDYEEKKKTRIPPKTKRCNECKETKLAIHYSRAATSSGGIMAICRTCRSKKYHEKKLALEPVTRKKVKLVIVSL